MNLKDKKALITGAARGIGRDMALCFADAGADLALVDLEEGPLSETKAAIEEKGRRALTFAVDVTDTDAAVGTVKEAYGELGGIDILVNNAGITRDNLLLRMKEQDWDMVLAVNAKGAFNYSKAVARYMLKAQSGSIINISSVIGVMGNAGQVNYSASKAALIGMTKSMAKELGSKSVRVNAIAPGYIITPMTDNLTDDVKEAIKSQIPLGRFGTTEDVSDTALFLASDRSRYLTGNVILVSGGMAM